MPYRKKASPNQPDSKGNPFWYVRVPTRNDGSVQMSTRSTVKKTAVAIERMLSQFQVGAKREYFDLVDAVHDGRIRLLDLLEADDNNALGELRAQLAPPPAPEASILKEISAWRRWLDTTVAADTADHYVSAVLTFPEMQLVAEAERKKAEDKTPKDIATQAKEEPRPTFTREQLLAFHWPPSALTRTTLYKWMNDLEVGAASKRKHHVAMRSFVDHLIRVAVVAGDNPMDHVPVPPAGDPRTKYLETSEAVRLVNAFEDPVYRAFNALMAGSGVEVSAALNIRRRDVYADAREVRAPGTKTYTRDRVVRVANWAWPFLEALLSGLAQDQKVFAAIPDRWTARRVFLATIFPLAMDDECFRGYTMRDHRHTYAVRAARAGTPPQLIAEQLGHRDAVLVLKVYGRFLPKSHERDRWEQKAAILDAQLGVTPGTANVALAAKPAPAPGRSSRQKIEWPDVSELLAMLERASAKAVAEQLGVSDIALRKHLKRRGVAALPDGRRSGVTRRPSPADSPEA